MKTLITLIIITITSIWYVNADYTYYIDKRIQEVTKVSESKIESMYDQEKVCSELSIYSNMYWYLKLAVSSQQKFLNNKYKTERVKESDYLYFEKQEEMVQQIITNLYKYCIQHRDYLIEESKKVKKTSDIVNQEPDPMYPNSLRKVEVKEQYQISAEMKIKIWSIKVKVRKLVEIKPWIAKKLYYKVEIIKPRYDKQSNTYLLLNAINQEIELRMPSVNN